MDLQPLLPCKVRSLTTDHTRYFSPSLLPLTMLITPRTLNCFTTNTFCPCFFFSFKTHLRILMSKFSPQRTLLHKNRDIILPPFFTRSLPQTMAKDKHTKQCANFTPVLGRSELGTGNFFDLKLERNFHCALRLAQLLIIISLHYLSLGTAVDCFFHLSPAPSSNPEPNSPLTFIFPPVKASQSD